MTERQAPSLEQIASSVGVSKMTVSRVLRGKDGFSDQTRQKVLAEVERLGYLPNRLAAAFGSKEASTLVGVCIPRFSSPYFSKVLESIDRTFLRLGYQTLIGSHNAQQQDEETWLRGLLSWRPAGVLLSSKNHSPLTIEYLRDATIPIVEFWDLSTRPLDLSVGFNQAESGYEMGRFALSKGRCKPALLGAAGDVKNPCPDRFSGFSKALMEAGHPIVASEILKDMPGFYAGYYGTETLLSRVSDIDMIYYQDDTMALGGIAWLQRHGISVPGDIGVAGWGGHEAASIQPKQLTTTIVPTDQIGKLSAELLVRRLRNEPVKEVTVVPTRLVPGETL